MNFFSGSRVVFLTLPFVLSFNAVAAETTETPPAVAPVTQTASTAVPLTNKKHHFFNWRQDDIKNSASAYVSSVFDRLQSSWEEQTYTNQSYSSQEMTMTLNPDGTIANSSTNQNIPASLLQAVQHSGPFPPFPFQLKGQQLEIKAQVTPESLQLVGYRWIEKKQNDSLITYVSPGTTQQPVSLFYTRALPTTVEQVKADSNTFGNGNGNAKSSMGQYISMVQEQIRRNWRLASDYQFQKTSALLVIDRNGDLLGAQLQHPSGDKIADQALLNAIYTAGPFPKAPADVPSLPIMIETIFEPMAAPVKE